MAGIRHEILSVLAICSALTSTVYSKTEIRLATGNKTGVYYPLGEAIKLVVEKAYPEIEVKVLSTDGSVHNATKIANGEADLAFIQNDVAYYFSEGKRMFEEPSDKMVGIGSLYTEFIQIVAKRNSGISEIEDLKNKTVRTTSRKGAVYSNASSILLAAGFNLSDITDKRLTFEESLKALHDRSIDAAFLTAGIPTPVITGFGDDVIIIPIRISLARRLRRSYPYFVYGSIPADTYSWQRNKITTVGVRALLVARRDLDADIVNKITSTVFGELEALSDAHPVGKKIKLAKVIEGMTIPLHPGAKSYYGYHIVKIKILERMGDILAAGICVILLIVVIKCRRTISSAVRKSIYWHLFVIFLCVYALAAIFMFFCERANQECFDTIWKAFWSTTLYILSGFGDRPPTTLYGRVVSVFIFGLGVVSAAMVTGIAAATFIRREELKMPSNIEKHIIICNWNKRGDRVVTELHSHQGEKDTHLVVITEKDVNERELRSESNVYENVFFVKSDPVLHSVLKASKVHLAKSIIILADDESPDPDAKSAMIALAIAKLCSGKAKPHVVAEVINHRMVEHLKDAQVEEIICATDFGLGVLAQCALHRKLSSVYNDLLRYSKDTNEIYIIEDDKFPKEFLGKSFEECAAIINKNRSSDNPAILLGLRRNDDIILNPRTRRKGQEALTISDCDALLVMAYRPPKLSNLCQ